MNIVAVTAPVPGGTQAGRDLALDQRSFDLLCLTMAVVLILHSPHLPAWLSMALGIVLVARWGQRRRHGGRVPIWLKLPLVLLLPVVVVAIWGTVFGRQPGSALAVGLLVLKLLESERPRDARTGIAFACFALMSALLFSQDLVATFVVALGLVPALATLRSLEPERVRPGWRRELLPVVAMLGLALPVALATFLFVPRLSSPLWGAPGESQARTGVGGSMAPGDFTQLLIDDSPALRVVFDGPAPPPAQRYFRGPILWRFDGRAWAASASHQVSASDNASAAEPMQPLGRVYAYDVTMQPSRRHWLFALDTPIEAPEDAGMTPERTLVRARRIDAVANYHVRSVPQRRLAPRLDPRERALGMQLPDGFDPRARALAQRWRRNHPADDRAIVQSALALFHDGGFSYTLLPAPLGRDSVDDFLFSTREGFCEHYASSFTFLMRAAGLPARIVTGYQGGFWNGLGSYLLVHQSDAHAWSEVWLPGQGWTRVDPTAAVRPERVSMGAAAAAGGEGAWYQSAWLQGIRNHWDIVNQWWGKAVIGFDALRQKGLLTPFGIRQAQTRELAMALAISVAGLMGAGLMVALWRRRRGDALDAVMVRLQRRLARAGVARRPSEGPRHFFTRAARSLPHERERLQRLGDMYVRLRYAADAPDPELLRNFRRGARNFRPRRVV